MSGGTMVLSVLSVVGALGRKNFQHTLVVIYPLIISMLMLRPIVITSQTHLYLSTAPNYLSTMPFVMCHTCFPYI